MSIKDYFKKHYIAVFVALFVGFIYVAPNLFFIFSLGDEYRGIPMLQTANDDYYVARIQEILDGHPAVGSHAFYEYKNEPPFAPPVGEMLYAVTSIIFRITPAHSVVVSHFILPFILFLLVYALLLKLSDGTERFAGKFNAIAGALFVTLGYDLIDYRTVLSFISGAAEPGGFLVWARPINPILGALFLFSFLLCVWGLVKKTRKKAPATTVFISASAFFTLMIASYFFSWGMALSISAVLIAIYSFRKEYDIAKNLLLMLFSGVALATPYWYFVWQASQSQWYDESLLRNGLFYTHYPLMNKLMLAVFGVYIAVIGWQYIAWLRSSREENNEEIVSDDGGDDNENFFKDWHIFCLAFIVGSLWAYSQQILTGQTVWPYHFVQYSIPLAIIVLMTIWYYVSYKKTAALLAVGAGMVIITSVFYGTYVQVKAFQNSYKTHVDNQKYRTLIDWLNKQEKDCVILISANNNKKYILDGLIPEFTHCNVYNSSWVFSLMPQERVRHNYFVRIFFNGATSQNIEQYLSEHQSEARAYLFSNWKGLYRVPHFPDFTDATLEERLKKIPEDYRRFVAGDWQTELKKYRLDYIASVGPLPQQIIDRLGVVTLQFQSNNVFLYSL